MSRKPEERVQVNLRIKEALRRKLADAAANHRVTFNKEMEMRLEDSFVRQSGRSFEEINADMHIVWQRYSERFLLLHLEDQLAEALSNSTDPNVATLAQVFLRTKAAQRKARALGLEK
jgi:hypothetical protein